MSTAVSGRLFEGDCLEVLTRYPTVAADLVYLDPPFAVGVQMSARTQPGERRGARRSAQSGPVAYDDTGDVPSLLAMLAPRLEILRERMAPHAALWLHLDHRAVHDAKVLADRVFGRGAFVGEVVWVPGNGARGARGFAVTHQTILLYARSAAGRRSVVYRADDPDLREPFAPGSLAAHFRLTDAEGRRYRERTLGGKTYRYYADDGRRRGSVWTDIPAMSANSPVQAEATGYPTQKPVRLLQRIVRASTHPGMMVLDPMCGSGTTLVAAAGLGRSFVGIDASSLAISVARKRLAAAEVELNSEA